MARSDRLRLSDVRAAGRLVGECRELGADFVAWKAHLQGGLARLTGGQMALGAAATGATPDGRVGVVRQVGTGWPDPAAEAAWAGWAAGDRSNHDPVVRRLAAAGLTRRVWTREQAVPDADWHASEAFNRLCRPFGADDPLMSVRPLAGGGLDFLVLFRPAGGRRPGRRERQLVDLAHGEAARLVGGPLAGAAGPSPTDLSPRLRAVLAGLLGGATEKELAARLGLRPGTVHGYVVRVYRHFGAASRAELMARFVRPPPVQSPA